LHQHKFHNNSEKTQLTVFHKVLVENINLHLIFRKKTDKNRLLNNTFQYSNEIATIRIFFSRNIYLKIKKEPFLSYCKYAQQEGNLIQHECQATFLQQYENKNGEARERKSTETGV